MIEKFLNWFDDSHHWQHLLGGAVIGFGADDEFCTIYTGAVFAAALEFKDKQWGGKIDYSDFIVTLFGAILGQGVRQCIML